MENSFKELEALLRINLSNLKILETHRKNGVEFLLTDGIIIEKNIKIGSGTKIYPGTILEGRVVIGKNCTLGPNTFIKDSEVGQSTTINSSQVRESTVGDYVNIGPFVQLRPGSQIDDRVRVGNFVEIKNSKIGENTSLSHLSYIGDSNVGKNVNLGCGTVTVNYDGQKKHSCIIEDNAFIGCQTALVAPVTVKKGGFTAAGSVITEDVPENALAIGRSRQINKEGWAKNKFKKSDLSLK